MIAETFSRIILLVCVALMCCPACKSPGSSGATDGLFTPGDSLRKLSQVEVLQYYKVGKLRLSGDNVTIYDINGKTYSPREAMMSFNYNSYMADYYVNSSGVVKAAVFHTIDEDEIEFVKEFIQLAKEMEKKKKQSKNPPDVQVKTREEMQIKLK